MPRLSLGLGAQTIRKVGGGAPFSPANLSGLSLWLKADAGVSLSGSDVTTWADQSGNGRHANSVDADPTYNSSDLNGKPTISLSSVAVGDNQSLSIDGNPIPAAPPLTLLTACTPNPKDNLGIKLQCNHPPRA